MTLVSRYYELRVSFALVSRAIMKGLGLVMLVSRNDEESWFGHTSVTQIRDNLVQFLTIHTSLRIASLLLPSIV